MNYLTFADRLIAEGVKFHPDTVIVNADAVAKQHYNDNFQDWLEGDLSISPSKPLFEHTFIEWVYTAHVTQVVNNKPLYRKETITLGVLSTLKQRELTLTLFSTFHKKPNPMCQYSSKCLIYYSGSNTIDTSDGSYFLLYEDNELLSPSLLLRENDKFALINIKVALLTHLFSHQPGQIIEVEHPRKVAKKIEKRTGKPPSNYYRVTPTITDIGPGAKQYKYNYKPNGNGSHSSPKEHIVRPHFRHVENHPLPQFNGTFYIPAHKRGSGGEGKARKIFRVVL